MPLSSKKIDLSEYDFEELIFTRDMTGEDKSKLIIKKDETTVYEDESYFSTINPADKLLTKDGVYSVVKDAQIIVKTNSNYTGTKYNESVTSTDANKKFNLKTGSDLINFSDNIGEDEIIFNQDGSAEDISNLMSAYTNFANNGYKFDSANSLNA